MAFSLKDKHDDLKLVTKKSEDFVKLNNIRIHCSELALGIIGMKCHISGSRSEGIHLGDSDTDILIYENDIEAVNDDQNPVDDVLQVKLENTERNPGYTMLKVDKDSLGRRIGLLQFLKQPIEFICNKVDDSYYMSTSKTINAMSVYTALKLPWTGGRLIMEENSGPAKHVTVEMGNKSSDLDILYTIHCTQGTQYMEEWQQRYRLWPPEDKVQEIMTLPVFLVPLEHPLRCNAVQDSQWKFSFNLQERTLMRNLKGPQILSYNILKSLKHYLKDLEDSKKGEVFLKSFYFKTCFLWTVEQITPSAWSEGEIIQNTILCVQYLLSCLREKKCPHYFIPENNLFEGKAIVSRNLTDLEGFLASICNEEHHIWADLLSKVLNMFNKPYMYKQPMLNSVSVCRHLLVLSVKEHNTEEALQNIQQRYNTINSLDIGTGLFDGDWKNSILLTLQSIIATLQCILEQPCSSKIGILNLLDHQEEKQCWKYLLREANEIDFCSGRLKEATVQYWLKNYESAIKVTQSVIERQAVNIMHHTGFTHVRDDTFNDEENSTKEWATLVKNHVYFDVLFIPAEIQVCPAAIQLELCEGRGLMINPLVYAYYLQFCIMQHRDSGTTPSEVMKLLNEWQILLDAKKMAGFNYIDFDLISFCYLKVGNFEKSYQNLQKGISLRDTGRAHCWILGLLVFHYLNPLPNNTF